MTIEAGRGTRHLMQTATLAAGVAALLAVGFAARAGGAPSKAGPHPPAVSDWALPAASGSQPDLAEAPDGSLLLSWVEGDGDGRVLRFARYAGGRWQAPRTVAQGDWFGNAMDTPHVRQTADGALWATWMRKTPAGGYARDIVLARSTDGGRNWSKPVPVNTDATATEHGFVSLWPAGRDALGVAWLDGRASAKGATGDGMTMVRSVRFDAALRRSAEAVADSSACDCCSTDVAIVEGHPLLVYRDRAPGEIRDISLTRLDGSAKARSTPVHRDGWVMPACPMNGPSVAAQARTLAVGWYTAAGDRPTVRVAVSTDGGGSFGRSFDLDSGNHVMGRVDTAIGRDRLWTSWLREDDGTTSIWLAGTPVSAAKPHWKTRIAAVGGRGPGLATPRLVAHGSSLYVAWADTAGGTPTLRGRRLDLR